MLRGMVFVDHMNFDIALQNLYLPNEQAPKLNYNTVFKGVVNKIENIEYLKTFIFIPKPDDFLMNDDKLLNYYKWVSGLSTSKYIDIIEGRYLARPTGTRENMHVNDKTTYYKIEKGTDINLAVHALTKAYNNSYDVAFVFSEDTDYKPVYKQLKNMGKIVVEVIVKGQKISSREDVDDFIILDKDFFNEHIRNPQNKSSFSYA